MTAHLPIAPARGRMIATTGFVTAELAIVVPTYNEAANVSGLVRAIDSALPDRRWEVVFVDDHSPDGTSETVRSLALADPRVRIVHRYGRRGLSSACVEGIMATAAPFVAVMDADFQHDEAILGAMLDRLEEGDVDVVVGSRYASGGGMGEWSRRRQRLSRLATRMAAKLAGTEISDPMSGYFMLTRAAFLRSLPNLSTIGFKILLDIAASAPVPLRVAELPYIFRTRQHGESKLDCLVVWEYFQLLLDKWVGHFVPVRFLSFALVGSFGVLVHFAVLTSLFEALGVSFGRAQAIATIVAISSNFFLNNVLTYRDQRLAGRALLFGWATFNLVCATGAAANIGVADWLFARHNCWVFSALAGIAVSVVWNYAMSSLFTWRKR